jgi:uncharacterized protein (TIGR04255 family)
MAKRQYEQPPLQEAIFELFFPLLTSWSPDRAAELARRLPSYSGKREDLEDFFFRLDPGRGVLQGVQPGARRTRLWSSDQSRAVQFGAEVCTYNARRPYGHFEDHVAAIQEFFGAYLDVMKPETLGWVGQRYLNIVRLPLEVAPAGYFQFFPRLPPGLPDTHRPFAVQIETNRFEQGNTVVNLGLLEFAPDAAVYTIDIYARSDETVPLSLDDIMAWQRRAHFSIGESFELTITDEARRLFKEVPCSP